MVEVSKLIRTGGSRGHIVAILDTVICSPIEYHLELTLPKIYTELYALLSIRQLVVLSRLILIRPLLQDVAD